MLPNMTFNVLGEDINHRNIVAGSSLANQFVSSELNLGETNGQE